MNKISDILPSTCQKLLKSAEICLSTDKNKSAQFLLRHSVLLLLLLLLLLLNENRHAAVGSGADLQCSLFVDGVPAGINGIV